MSQESPDGALDAVAKHIGDLQHLVTLLLQGLSRAKPWQRQLSGHLSDVDKQLQVLRLTIAVKRNDDEILMAVEHLTAICRLSAAALAGSRVDPTTRTAVYLIGDLASRIKGSMGDMPPGADSGAG